MVLLGIRWLLPWSSASTRTPPKTTGRHRVEPGSKPTLVAEPVEYQYPRVRKVKQYRWTD